MHTWGLLGFQAAGDVEPVRAFHAHAESAADAVALVRKDPANGEWLHTFSIIATAANALMTDLHDRMPVILPPSRWATWLGEQEATEAELVDALQPYDAAQMRVWPVSRDVGNVRNDRSDVMDPIASLL